MLGSLLFIAVLIAFGYILWKRGSRIAAAIRLGRPAPPQGAASARWRNVALVAFGQKKMFKQGWPAFLHLWIYIGFIVINVEVAEFIVDGIAGSHRIAAPLLGRAYPALITLFEFLALAVFVACAVFLARRNIVRVKRFWTAEMTRWPRLDGNLILIIEMALMAAILAMNAADQVLQARGQYPDTGPFFFSGWIAPLLTGIDTPALIYLERACWWLHIVGILGFAVYITYSKHLHLFMAFPNTYYASLAPKGYVAAMPVVTREVKAMLEGTTPEASTEEQDQRLGAKDVDDLSRSNLLGAYTCSECGRCTEACPAHMTGKKLSPRKIMMDVRRRLTDVMNASARGATPCQDGKALLGDYITHEEINACTSCNACVEACPILINPLDIILQLRRYAAMEQSKAPAQWNAMFQNIETNFAPWKFAAADRFAWAKELNATPPSSPDKTS